MNFSKTKIFFLVLFFSLFFVVSVYANFCSLIPCKTDDDCVNTCDGSYWYYGNGTCSEDCYFACSKHCEYNERVCADSDKSDNFPKIQCCVRTCNAECDQDSDCLCPEDGCVDQDYYDYPEYGVCNESCECYCEPVITVNDSKCYQCEDNDKDGYYNYSIYCPEGDDCDDSNPNINPGAEEVCDDGFDNDCDDLIDLNDSDCYQCVDDDEDGYYKYDPIYCLEGDDCDDSNPNVNPDATEVCDDGIDNNCDNQIDCDDPACSEHPSCIQSPPPPSGEGPVMGGGVTLGGQVRVAAVCGNNNCEYSETCSNCPEDCLKEGEICCNDIAYIGNCCVDADCEEGYECDISKTCQLVYVKEEEKPEVCGEDWGCIKWSDCINGTQTRKCVDKNDCGTIEKRPDLIQECEEPTPTGLFAFLTSPIGYGTIIIIITLFLIVFFWRRGKR